MTHSSNSTSLLRLQVAALSALIAGLVLASAASAVDLDFNVANGNYNVAGNWIETDTGAVSASPPTIDDTAFVRNNGTLLINSDVENLQMRIGYSLTIIPGDYNDDGIVDAADYVVWRKGGPLLNDATPGNQPGDYTVWRSQFGNNTAQQLGMPGTLNWTAGKITGIGTGILNGGDPYSGGPDIRVGRVDALNSVPYEVTGTVVQNGPTTELLLPYQQSRLTIGDGGSFTHTPTSSYTLMDGTIGTAIGSTLYQNNGTNGNNGILVRNGTFTMTGGQIIDVTPSDYLVGQLTTQRFLTVATATGGGVGNESVSTANLTGGNINVLGGIRVATANNSRGYLNINENNGPLTIVTGGDTSIGYEPTNTGHTNAVGEMNMSAGSFQVGREDIPNQTGTGLRGRFIVGDRGKGFLNMSGGAITVTRDIRVGARNASGGSVITMTGGTITTPALDMGNVNTGEAHDPAYLGASIILDGSAAVFTQNGSGGTIIGDQGKSLFEVRQGTALLGGGGSAIELGKNSTSEATLNVMGGKLTIGGNVSRTNTSSTAPVIGLTGGTLEFNNTTTTLAQAWQPDFTNAGSELVLTQGALRQVVVGDSVNYPSNFAMTSGSWDLEIGLNTTLGADWFNAWGMAELTGGTLNLSYINGFTPNINEAFRILRGRLGVTLGTVAITGAGAGSWMLQTVPIVGTVGFPNDAEIQLKYVGPGAGAGGVLGTQNSTIPEPSPVALLVFAVAGLFAETGKRNRTGTQRI